MSDEPRLAERIDHIRRLDLPWRRATLTECGLPVSEHPTITADEADEKIKRLGKQRASLFLCQTCCDTSERWAWRTDCDSDGSRDPALIALRREVAWVTAWRRKDRSSSPLVAEIHALGALVARHRVEFDELVADQQQTVSLDAARVAKMTRGKRL